MAMGHGLWCCWDLCVGLLLVVPLLLFLLDRWAHNYWKRQGVFQLDPIFFFGNIKDILLSKKPLVFKVKEIYREHKDKKLVGFYSLYRRMLIVTDPVLAKEVLTKNFRSFSASGVEMEGIDPLMALNPFSTIDFHGWKERRGIHVALHTPAKLKLIPGYLMKSGHSMLKYISGFSGKPIYVKELTLKFTIDAAVTTAYGMDPGAFDNPEYVFTKHAKDTAFYPRMEDAFEASILYPFIGRLQSLRFFSKEFQDFFSAFTSQALAQREEVSSTRGDILDAIIRINKKLASEGKKGLEESLKTGHFVIPYLDSVFTTSMVLQLVLLELAINPKEQELAREEILAAGDRPEDFNSLEKIGTLKYLQMVINETLRMHPILLLFVRLCSKTTELGGVRVEQGTKVFLPPGNFHMDPDYFPDPEEFKPERFADWNDNGTFLPFGVGPRMCLGSRYAQIVIKMGLIFVLQKFRVMPGGGLHVKDYFPDKFLFNHSHEMADLLFLPL